MKTKAGLSLTLLKISIGIFFILLGILGILPVEESAFSLLPGAGWGVLEVIFGCVELICGVLIILSLFTFLTKRIKELVSLIILIFWCARVVISKVIFDLMLPNQFLPNFAEWFSQWLLIVSAQLLIAAALWVFYKASRAK